MATRHRLTAMAAATGVLAIAASHVSANGQTTPRAPASGAGIAASVAGVPLAAALRPQTIANSADDPSEFGATASVGDLQAAIGAATDASQAAVTATMDGWQVALGADRTATEADTTAALNGMQAAGVTGWQSPDRLGANAALGDWQVGASAARDASDVGVASTLEGVHTDATATQNTLQLGAGSGFDGFQPGTTAQWLPSNGLTTFAGFPVR